MNSLTWQVNNEAFAVLFYVLKNFSKFFGMQKKIPMNLQNKVINQESKPYDPMIQYLNQFSKRGEMSSQIA